MLHDRDYMKGRQANRWLGSMWSDAVTVIVTVNVLVYLFQLLFNGGAPFSWGVLSIKALSEGKVWTLFTHMFLHAGIFHIAGNALMIFFTGKALQSLIGTRNFLYVYFLSGLGGAVMEMGLGWAFGPQSQMVGASGCAFGLLMGLAVMLPREEITALIYFVIPVRMRLWNIARLFMGVSLLLGILQLAKVFDMGIAHFAHVGGGLTGWWFVRMLGYGGGPITYDRLWKERQRREKSRELVVVRKPAREVLSAKIEKPSLPIPQSMKDFMEREIDPILDKIAEHGISSLTNEEKELLERARNQIMNRDGK